MTCWALLVDISRIEEFHQQRNLRAPRRDWIKTAWTVFWRVHHAAIYSSIDQFRNCGGVPSHKDPGWKSKPHIYIILPSEKFSGWESNFAPGVAQVFSLLVSPGLAASEPVETEIWKLGKKVERWGQRSTLLNLRSSSSRFRHNRTVKVASVAVVPLERPACGGKVYTSAKVSAPMKPLKSQKLDKNLK